MKYPTTFAPSSTAFLLSLPSSFLEKEFWHEMAHGEKETVDLSIESMLRAVPFHEILMIGLE
ncbi:hypothetical protein AAZX31_02G253000 [Glycine max]